MFYVFMILLATVGANASSADLLPSSQSCEYYNSLESSLQCGPENYLTKSAYPLCRYYQEVAAKMTPEIQAWFPEVRFCLQDLLQENESQLRCETMNETAIQSHVECYIKTGYCELPLASRAQLTWIMLPRMKELMWLKTAALILQACEEPAYQR